MHGVDLHIRFANWPDFLIILNHAANEKQYTVYYYNTEGFDMPLMKVNLLLVKLHSPVCP